MHVTAVWFCKYMVNLALQMILPSDIHYRKMTGGVSWGKQAVTYPPLHRLAGKRSPGFQLTKERRKGGKKGRRYIFIAGMGCAFGSTAYHQLTKLNIHISSEQNRILSIAHMPSPNVELPKLWHLTHRELHAGTARWCQRQAGHSNSW